MLYVSQAEFAFALLDGAAYQLRFGTFGLGHLADPLFEFMRFGANDSEAALKSIASESN